MRRDTPPSHRLDRVVDCVQWIVEVHSSPMAVWSCRILAGTGTRCRTRRSVQIIPNMFSGQHVWQELGCFHLPGIVHRSLRMVVKWRFSSFTDIPAASMLIARFPQNLRHLWGCVVWFKNARFRVTFYCDQPQSHLCNNHVVWSASWYATPVKVGGISWQMRHAH